MKFILSLLLFFPVLFTVSPAFSQSKLSISKVPTWITKKDIDYNSHILDRQASDGYIDLAYECQVSLADQTEFIRRAKKIISSAGVQNASEISVPYDPSYEQLIFHNISILRNGETINKLNLSKFKTVHQEEDLTHFIYNGSINAFLVLDDVRQGDIIEYSYSRKGFNPVFKNKYSESFPMNFTYPFYDIYYKVLVPQGRILNVKALNAAPASQITSVNGQQVYEWHIKDVKALILQDHTPSWYDPYDQVRVSEFNNWKEVNDWALELFPVKKELSKQLQQKIKEIEGNAVSDAQKLQSVLRFVQDDIRYMGIEMGENTHRPADPSKVFAQRFGDCKEKSYLACCMLNAMNIEANPVLINTDYKSHIANVLPAPTDFNHCTMRVKLEDTYYWYDPTISYQRGDVKKIFYPDYQAGLVIAANTTSLSAIPFRNVSLLKIENHFRVTAMNGSGTLIVKSAYSGAEADRVRDDFSNSSEAELMKSYQKYYSNYFDDIISDSIQYTDNDETGIFETTEYYTLPAFWKADTTDGANIKKFSFSAFSINSILQRVKEKQRTMPIGLPFPAKYKEDVSIELPNEWSVTETDKHYKNKSYSYDYHFYCLNNIVHLDAEYENLKANVSVDESTAYFKDLDFGEDFANFQISWDYNLANKPSSKPGGSGYIGLFVLLIIGAAVWWSKRNR